MNPSPICQHPNCSEPSMAHRDMCTQHWVKPQRRSTDKVPQEPAELAPPKGVLEFVPTGVQPNDIVTVSLTPARREGDVPMSVRYPKYYKAIPLGMTEIDTYGVNLLFPVDDPTGCIIHARKKLLVPGTRTGGKSMVDDIREARDTLSRWLELQASKAE